MFKNVIIKLFKGVVVGWMIEKMEDPKFEEMVKAEIIKKLSIPKMSKDNKTAISKEIYTNLKKIIVDLLTDIKE